MGHLGRIKDEYRALARRLEAGQVGYPEPEDERAWNGWKEILEILYSPEEAALAARLPTRPSSLTKIAARTGVPEDELRGRLEALCDRGVVADLVDPKTGSVRYALSPPVVGFIELSMMRRNDTVPKKRMAEALEAYLHGDETFAREAFGGETVIGRALARESALGEELPDVLAWERATALVEEAKVRAVSLCFCRHKAEHLGEACDAPVELCLSLDGGAEHVIRRGFGRTVDAVEAKDMLVRAREHGLVQIADNVLRRPAYICNCCACCCEQLRAITRYDLRGVNPSGFVPALDAERCRGCSRCARACPVGAVRMSPERITARRRNELRPELDLDRCIGCGLCVDACRNRAVSLRRAAARPDVPETSLERVVRMALERGHLASLFFDEGEGRGARLLNRLARAVAGLAPVERALAQGQLKSRFVRGLIERARRGKDGLPPIP